MSIQLVSTKLISDKMVEDEDKITYTVKYYFKTSTRCTSAVARTVIKHAIYETYEDDKTARAKTINIESDSDEGTNWWAVITYERPGMSDPLKKEPKITFTNNQYEMPVAFAYKIFPWNGVWEINTDLYPTIPITNSAGDPFDPPLTMKYAKLLINIEWNIEKFSPELKGWYEESITATDIRVAGIDITKGYARMESLDFEPRYWYTTETNKKTYWAMSCKIEIDYSSCIKFLLDAGYNYVKWAGTAPNRTYTKYKFLIGGQSPDHPQLLNGDGEMLDLKTLNPQTKQPNQPTYRAYQVNRGIDWTPLSLPKEMVLNQLSKG